MLGERKGGSDASPLEGRDGPLPLILDSPLNVSMYDFAIWVVVRFWCK